MSEELVTIEGQARRGLGKSNSRKIRKDGWVPANLNINGKNEVLEISPKWLGKAYKMGKQFNLVYNGETRQVKVIELQIDPVRRVPLHVDIVYA